MAAKMILWVPIALSVFRVAHTKPTGCELLASATTTNFSQILGKWYYVAGVSEVPEYQKEMELVDSGYVIIHPTDQENSFYITEYGKLSGGQCVTDDDVYSLANDSNTVVSKSKPYQKIQIFNTTCPHCLINHVQDLKDEKVLQGLFMYARNQTVSEEALEAYKSEVKCFGLTEKDIFILNEEKEQCQLTEKGEQEIQTRIQKILEKSHLSAQ
nr:PREDICTED: alpha-1-acid glycoprotein 3-like [Latimeria chalumnae]|eukprot:XP_014342301.1 PREDICTED: alpha-1-acid glycoprotein 3-like [Latimeria chalumnae]